MTEGGSDNKPRFASGVSSESNVDAALDAVLGPVADALGSRADLVIAFVTPHHSADFPRIAERIEKQLGPAVALAVTGGAVLGNGRELEQGAGLSLLAGSLPGVDLFPFDLETLDWPECEENPQRLREVLGGTDDGIDPECVLIFADPFSTPMVKLIPTISDTMPGVPIVGGMASAGFSPGDNRLLLNDKIDREGLVGVGIRGALRVDCTVSQGCRPIGEPWVITRAKNNVLMELGGQNVIRAIRSMIETLKPEDESLARQGLLIGRVIDEYKDHFGRGDFLIRSIMGADEKTGFLEVGDLLHVGQTIQFHVRDAKAAEEDLRLLLENQKLHGAAAGALLCTCNGRGTNLFRKPGAESAIILDAIGNAPMAGFFAAGEIGPVGPHAFLHGFTASLAVFREKVSG